MESRKIIGAKAKYGILDLFVYRRQDGRYALCMMNADEKTGWPEESHDDFERAKDALATHAVHSILPEDFRDEDKPRIEDLRNWTPLYDGQLPEACLRPRHGRHD